MNHIYCIILFYIQDSVKAESGKDFLLDEKYGFLHSCPTNLGTGMSRFVLKLLVL